MTPQERDLINDLLDRLDRQRLDAVDDEAADLIDRAMRDMPDAPYKLVQSVIVQNMALERAEARIEELERQLRDARDARGERGRGAPASGSGGSFLGGIFGGGRRDDRDDDDYDDRDRRRSFGRDSRDDDDARDRRPAIGRSDAPGSVPSFVPRAGGAGTGAGGPDGSRPWVRGRTVAPVAGRGAPAERGGFGGGSFLGTALTTAAGVAGGMLLADGIRGMFGGDDAVKSAGDAASQSGTQTASADQAEPGVTDASAEDGEGGGFFDSLFGGGDDVMDI